TLRIKCRIEELPAIGGFLLDSMNTDLTDFTAFSPDYDAAFVTAAQSALTGITALIIPKTLTAELKVITLRMYNNMAALPQKIDFLEGYIKRTSGLTVAAKDFGISAVRKANNKGDVEGLVQALNYTLALAHNAANKPLLQAKGYVVGQQTALTTIMTDLNTDNVAQNAKVNARNTLVTANAGVINAFWDTLTDISDAGKRIYKKSNKKDDYTIAVLKRRIRNEALKNKMIGSVTSAGENVNGAKISMKPVLGGRTRSTKSKASSKYELKSLAATDWIVTVSATGKVTQNRAVKIVTGETLTEDFDLAGV
ncbi:MAG: carboxypeptidase-like regulatory domain-containing protein, partial [Bacteroidota bacterium]